MTENGSLIPNTFQHPNLYIDRLAYFLTPEEQVVLNKAVREILGWKDKRLERQAYIALSVFVDGKFNKEGNRLCYGCGLNKDTVRKALKQLSIFGVLRKGEITQDGQLYTLQIDADRIDWQKLEARRAEWDETNRKRTEKAREKQAGEGGSVAQEEVVSDTMGGVVSDSNKETHLETHNDDSAGAESCPEEKPTSPATLGAERMFQRLTVEQKAKGRQGPKYFPSLACKAKFEEAETRLGQRELEAAIQRGLEKGILAVGKMTDWVAKWSPNGNRARAGPRRDKPFAGLTALLEEGFSDDDT